MIISETPKISNEEYWRRVRAQREQDDPAQDPNWRLLEPIGTREQVDAVLKLMEGDMLSKLAIALILVTFKLDPGQNIATILPPHLVPEQLRKENVNDEKSTQEATGQS